MKGLEKVEKQVGRVNSWTTFVSRAWAGWLVVAPIVWAISGAAMSQLSGLPWWGIVLVATAFTALVMIIWLVARILWLTRHLRQLDLSALAKDCLAFREDLVRFLAERKTSEPSTRQKVFTEEDRLRYVDHSGRTALLLHANFGARAEALAQMLRIAEIPPPNLRGFDTFPDAVGNYFHVVGTLVSKGLLSEARALDPNGPIRVTI